MRRLYYPAFVDLSAATSQHSAPINSAFMVMASAVVVFSGGSAPNGTIKLQASNDIVAPGLSPTNWSDIPNTNVSVSSNDSYLIPATELSYGWIRLAYVSSSGGDTMDGNIKTVGA